MLLAAREYSGRGVDFYDEEDWVSLSELIESYPDKLMLLIASVIAFILAYFLVSKRESLLNDRHWYFIQDNDNTLQKVIIVVCWIVFVIGLLPAVFTGIDILWRIIVGGTLTIIQWILEWIISLLILLAFIALIPMVICSVIAEKSKAVAIIIGVVLVCLTTCCVAHYWSAIMKWSFMFPTLEFNL